jgi:hypothetical protein
MEPHDPASFLHELAPHILAELKPPTGLKYFTTNPEIIGCYVEAGVRQFVRKYLSPIRVSTGAVIDQFQSRGSISIPQIDTIAWVPYPAPAVFEIGEFALVPRSSCLGILEVKSSAYSKVDSALKERLEVTTIRALTAEPIEGEDYLQAVAFGMGVICLQQTNQGSSLLDELRESGRVVVLFEEKEKGECTPNTADIFGLVNFLSAIRLRAALRESHGIQINVDLLRKPNG